MVIPGNPLASSKMCPISEIKIVINFTKQRIKASEFPVETQIALGLTSIIALEFMGLESSSIALVLPRYVLVAIISVLGDGFQICKDSYTQNTLAKIRSKFSFLSFVTLCLDSRRKSEIHNHCFSFIGAWVELSVYVAFFSLYTAGMFLSFSAATGIIWIFKTAIEATSRAPKKKIE